MSYVEPETVDAIGEAIRRHLTPDLLKPEWRRRAEGKHYTTGHCYVASEALYHLAGGPAAGLESYQVVHEGASHWFLTQDRERVVDLTAEQFETPPDYTQATRRRFLTREPSKRARVLMQRVREEIG